MKLLFLGLMYPVEEEELLLSKSRCGLQSAANTYQWGLIEGLDQVSEDGIELLSSRPVGTFPMHYKDLFLPSRSWSHHKGARDKEIGYINLPILKQLIRFFRIYIEMNSWCKKNRKEEAAILCYSIYPFYLKILQLMKRKYGNVCICLILPDVPNLPGYRLYHGRIRQLLYSIKVKLVYQYMKSVDVQVLLTDNMLLPLGHTIKPYVVIEGICSLRPLPLISDTQNSHIIFLYTGALIRAFGMDKMLAAFQSLPKDNFRLWICGTGDYRKEIEASAAKDSRITYYGYVSKEESLKLQQLATILINPRSDDCEYTKYSFPSKTMEYLSSAKPVLMFRLEGIPREYDDYLYYIRENTVEGIAQAILETAAIPPEQLIMRGKKAREFVSLNKNSTVQAGKIITMLKQYFEGNNTKGSQNRELKMKDIIGSQKDRELKIKNPKSSHKPRVLQNKYIKGSHKPSVLQINITCQIGSTGRIVEDIHHYITGQGLESHIAYSAYHSSLENSFPIESRLENYLRRGLNRFFGRKYAHSAPGTYRLIRTIKRLQPDIIHLHNIQQNSVHFPMLMKFLKEYDTPVVYTLHDCWSFTGGCYHFTAAGCNGYQTGCTQCLLGKEHRYICNKSPKEIYEEKDNALHSIRKLQVICISGWQYHCAKQSFMRDLPLRVIYNGIDTDMFQPSEINTRQELRISQKEFVILGVAGTWTRQKGLEVFITLSHNIKPPYRIVLVGELTEKVPDHIITVPRTDSIERLVALYNTADVFLNASKEEAFGLTSVEAMACGIPVITSHTTACAEVVGEGTGIVLSSFSTAELLISLEKIRNSPATEYKDNCVQRAKSLFSRDSMLKNYLGIYEKLLR